VHGTVFLQNVSGGGRVVLRGDIGGDLHLGSVTGGGVVEVHGDVAGAIYSSDMSGGGMITIFKKCGSNSKVQTPPYQGRPTIVKRGFCTIANEAAPGIPLEKKPKKPENLVAINSNSKRDVYIGELSGSKKYIEIFNGQTLVMDKPLAYGNGNVYIEQLQHSGEIIVNFPVEKDITFAHSEYGYPVYPGGITGKLFINEDVGGKIQGKIHGDRTALVKIAKKCGGGKIQFDKEVLANGKADQILQIDGGDQECSVERVGNEGMHWSHHEHHHQVPDWVKWLNPGSQHGGKPAQGILPRWF